MKSNNVKLLVFTVSMLFALALTNCGSGGGGGSGSTPWTKQLGVVGASTVADGVAVDSSGNVYVAGTTTGGLDGNTLTGTTDFFLVKYDSSGNKVRTKQLGVAGAAAAADGVAVDSSGNVYVAGTTTGGLDGNTLTGTEDFFLVKYDSSGNKQ